MRYPWPPSDGDAAWHGGWPVRPPMAMLSARARLLLPVVISLLIQLPAAFWVWRDHRAELQQAGPSLLLAVLLALVGPLALLGAPRFPGPVVAFVTLAAGADLLYGVADAGPPYIALAFAIVGAVARGARLWAWISVAVGWAGTLSAAALLGAAWQPARIALTTFGILVVLGIGESMRTRAERYEQFTRRRAERRQSEVQAERVRIARELHDVLAHSLSQINVQAGVGLHLAESQPEKAREALASIKESSKTALDEVRSVLGVLRAGGTGESDAPLVPEPDLSRIGQLATSITAQGVAVTVSPLPDGVPGPIQLAIYRIVQESLTNVLRHAQATRATVEVVESSGEYVVTVTDDGSAGVHPRDDSGRGLLGMIERAELLGGTLTAGARPGGGFRVTARIPAPAGAPA